MTPDHCPECRKVGVVATVNGPTCTCHAVKWWPENWAKITEQERLEWIQLVPGQT